jgi:hypothetical protein
MYMSLLAAVLCIVVCRYCYGEGYEADSPSHPSVGMQGWMVEGPIVI